MRDEKSQLLHSDDFFWKQVCYSLSFVNLCMFGRTCKRFFCLVKKMKRFTKAEQHLSQVWQIPMEYGFLSTFPSEINFFFS